MNRLLTLLFIAACAHFAWKHFSGSDMASVGDMSAEEIRTLATTVKPEDVVMYSTTECSYCRQAKSWLQQYGFAFTECNMRLEPHCEQEFSSYGANGTPYLLVRRNGAIHHMKDGFDSDEFLAVLQP